MKRIIIIALLLFGFSFGAVQQIEAKIPVVYGNGLTGKATHQLPEDFKIEGQHANLGVMYDQFSLFWMPIWNYGEPKYALINDAEDTYWDLDEEDVVALNEEYKLGASLEPSIPFWTKVGGKPLIILLVIFIAYSYLTPKKS